MITKEAMQTALDAYDIEAACIQEMKEFVQQEHFSKAMELLCAAPRIGAAGCAISVLFTSTTALCMTFHALQAAMIEQTGYQAEQFTLIHPGGAVGERLNHKVL